MSGKPEQAPESLPVLSWAARYSSAVLIATWLFLPFSAWIVFGVVGFWKEWWAWAPFFPAGFGVTMFLASPWSVECHGTSLIARRVWRSPEEFDLTKLTWSIGRPSLLNHLLDADSITASDGRSFLVFPTFLSDYDELKSQLGLEPN